MNDFNIRIGALPPMRLAVFRGFGITPELEAHDLAVAFAQEFDLIENNKIKTFGFNKPSPWLTSGDEYGYEIWVVVGSDVEVPHYVLTKEFPGADCVVTSINRLADIGAAWKYLYDWVKDNEEYQHAHMDGLEEVLSPLGTPEYDLAFNLYLPVERR
jgi:DNA gyrase inhibitor GyrI